MNSSIGGLSRSLNPKSGFSKDTFSKVPTNYQFSKGFIKNTYLILESLTKAVNTFVTEHQTFSSFLTQTIHRKKLRLKANKSPDCSRTPCHHSLNMKR